MKLARSTWLFFAAVTVVLVVSTGIRHTFGLFLPPMSEANGWGREVFAFAIAVQNLIWGASQPFTGMLADRYGAGKTIAGGAVLYALGLYFMAEASTPGTLIFSSGLLIGLGLSGTTFAVVLGALGRAVAPEQRSMALGIGAAIGSFGQFAMLPATLGVMEAFGWANTLLVMAALAALMVPMAAAVIEKPHGNARAEASISTLDALREAMGHRGFWLLAGGFFVCGFHVVFIGIHLPAYLTDNGLNAKVGTTALALIGLFNIFGTYLAGWLGSRVPQPMVLAGIYFGRAVAIALFLLAPLSEWSVYLFSAAIGFLWLSTVPPTNGTVARIFGVRNMSMLTGIVFFAHQVGAFLGGWLGGYAYDLTGSYDSVWIISIALGVVAGLFNLPIRERPVARLAGQPA